MPSRASSRAEVARSDGSGVSVEGSVVREVSGTRMR